MGNPTAGEGEGEGEERVSADEEGEKVAVIEADHRRRAGDRLLRKSF